MIGLTGSLFIFSDDQINHSVHRLKFSSEILTTIYYDHHQFHPSHDVVEHIHSQVYECLPTGRNWKYQLLMPKVTEACYHVDSKAPF